MLWFKINFSCLCGKIFQLVFMRVQLRSDQSNNGELIFYPKRHNRISKFILRKKFKIMILAICTKEPNFLDILGHILFIQFWSILEANWIEILLIHKHSFWGQWQLNFSKKVENCSTLFSLYLFIFYCSKQEGLLRDRKRRPGHLGNATQK